MDGNEWMGLGGCHGRMGIWRLGIGRMGIGRMRIGRILIGRMGWEDGVGGWGRENGEWVDGMGGWG